MPAENFELNKKSKAAEQRNRLISAAQEEIVRLRNFTRQAIEDKKTQKEEPLLQYAKDFEAIQLNLIDANEAYFLDRVMHSDDEEDYEDLVKKIAAYRKRLALNPSESEQKSHTSFLNYIGNKAAVILERALEKESK